VVKMENKNSENSQFKGIYLSGYGVENRKLTSKSLIQSILITLSEKILPESEKQELLKLCIKYNPTEEHVEGNEIFFNEDDIAVIYRELKLISSGMQIFDEAVEHALQRIIKYTKHDVILNKEILTAQQIKDGL